MNDSTTWIVVVAVVVVVALAAVLVARVVASVLARVLATRRGSRPLTVAPTVLEASSAAATRPVTALPVTAAALAAPSPVIVLIALTYEGVAIEPIEAVFDAPGGTIGRAEGNLMVLPDPGRTLSRVHAQVILRNAGHAIKDRGSNPIQVNGNVLGHGKDWPLAAGDVVRIGGYQIGVRASGSAAASVDRFADRFAPDPSPGPASAVAPDLAPMSPAAAPAPVVSARDPVAEADSTERAQSGGLQQGPVSAPTATGSEQSIDDLFGLGDEPDPADPAGPGDGDGAAAVIPAAGASDGAGEPRPRPRLGDRLPGPAPTRRRPVLSWDGGERQSRIAAPPGAARRTGRAAIDPILFGLTAPGQCTRGARFDAVLAAYVESARTAAEARLERLGGAESVPLVALSPERQSGWTVGAPVTVRLSASGALVSPAEQAFEWNGRLQLAPFVVTVDAAAAAPRIDLCFQVALAGVPIALIPLAVELVERVAQPPPPESAPTARTQAVRAASTVFASYASKDAQAVRYCLAALSRWSPGLVIFQDCLDLLQGDAFKPRLEQQIRRSDACLLFWSRHASASPWVRWEYDTARAGKGLDAVIPMPLEDPAIAPPPPEFSDLHLCDRFMQARDGMARIGEQAAAAGRA